MKLSSRCYGRLETVILLFWPWKSVRVFTVLDLVVEKLFGRFVRFSEKLHDLSPFKFRKFYKDVKLLWCSYLRVESIC